MRILGDIALQKASTQIDDNLPINLARSEPILEAPCKIPGRQEKYPAAHLDFISIPSSHWQKERNVIHPFPVVKDARA